MHKSTKVEGAHNVPDREYVHLQVGVELGVCVYVPLAKSDLGTKLGGVFILFETKSTLH